MARKATNETKVKMADGSSIRVTYNPPALNDFNSMQVFELAGIALRAKCRALASKEYLRLADAAQANMALAKGMLASGLIGAGMSEEDKGKAIRKFFDSMDKPLCAPTVFNFTAPQALGVDDDEDDE